MSDQGMDGAEAARLLDMMRTTRGALARRARWSFDRHAVVGLMLGGMIAGYALPGAWPIMVVAACLAATAMVVARDRRRDGFFVNGYRPGRTRWLTFIVLAAELSALVGAMVLKTRYGLNWAPVAIGIVMVFVGTMGSFAWQRVYRRELEGTSVER